METINVEQRDFSVKPKQLRRLGKIPGSVLGKSLPETLPIQMDESAARLLVTQLREGSKVQLKLGAKTIPVQIKEKSVDTMNHQILQITFQALAAGEKINSVIHILLKNEDKITDELEKVLLEIPYSSLPGDMIDTITIDLDGLKSGYILAVKDIPELMSKKIDLQVEPDNVVFRICERKIVVEETEEAAE